MPVSNGLTRMAGLTPACNGGDKNSHEIFGLMRYFFSPFFPGGVSLCRCKTQNFFDNNQRGKKKRFGSYLLAELHRRVLIHSFTL